MCGTTAWTSELSVQHCIGFLQQLPEFHHKLYFCHCGGSTTLAPEFEGASAILQGVHNCRPGKSGFRCVFKEMNSKLYRARIWIEVRRT
jgi:hypothetical protein